MKTEKERAVEHARDALDAAEADLASGEDEFRVVAHIVSRGKEGMTARLVLKDTEGFYRAVLAVGEPNQDRYLAVESAIRVWDRNLLSSVDKH